MRRLYRWSLLGFVLCIASGFDSCTLTPNPLYDMAVAVNSAWIVTVTNTVVVFKPAPPSASPKIVQSLRWLMQAGCDYYGGALVVGDPMVRTDEAGRFWYAILYDKSGPPVERVVCLFGTTTTDPRGPFTAPYIVPAADGLWVNVSSDKVTLSGYTGIGVRQLHVVNRVDLLANQGNAARTTTFPLVTSIRPIANRHPTYPDVALFFGPSPTLLPGNMPGVRLIAINGVPGVGAGVSKQETDLMLQAIPNGISDMHEKPPDTTQPDGSLVTFPAATVGAFNRDGTTWIAQAGPVPGQPTRGQLCWIPIRDLWPSFTPALAFWAGCTQGSTNGSMGCPTLAARDDGSVSIGVSVASPTRYLTAERYIVSLNASTIGPLPSFRGSPYPPGGTQRLDYCTGATAPDGRTACHAQAYVDANGQCVVTRCDD